MTPEAWAFCGLCVTTAAGLVGLLVDARRRSKASDNLIEREHEQTRAVTTEAREELLADAGKKDEQLHTIHVLVNSQLEEMKKELQQSQARVIELERMHAELQAMVFSLKADRRKKPRS